MDDDALRRLAADDVGVFARTSPEHKLRVVEALHGGRRRRVDDRRRRQ